MSGEGVAHGGAIELPQPHCVVPTTTDDRLPIWTEGNSYKIKAYVIPEKN